MPIGNATWGDFTCDTEDEMVSPLNKSVIGTTCLRSDVNPAAGGVLYICTALPPTDPTNWSPYATAGAGVNFADQTQVLEGLSSDTVVSPLGLTWFKEGLQADAKSLWSLVGRQSDVPASARLAWCWGATGYNDATASNGGVRYVTVNATATAVPFANTVVGRGVHAQFLCPASATPNAAGGWRTPGNFIPTNGTFGGGVVRFEAGAEDAADLPDGSRFYGYTTTTDSTQNPETGMQNCFGFASKAASDGGNGFLKLVHSNGAAAPTVVPLTDSVGSPVNWPANDRTEVYLVALANPAVNIWDWSLTRMSTGQTLSGRVDSTNTPQFGTALFVASYASANDTLNVGPGVRAGLLMLGYGGFQALQPLATSEGGVPIIPVDPGDIGFYVNSAWTPAQVPNYILVNCQNNNGQLNSFSGAKIDGTYTVNGSSLRMGQDSDPTGRFADGIWKHWINAETVPPTSPSSYPGNPVAPRYDGATGNGIRAELIMSPLETAAMIPYNQTTWIAVSLFFAAGQECTTDEQLFMQFKAEAGGTALFQMSWDAGLFKALVWSKPSGGSSTFTTIASEAGLPTTWQDIVIRIQVKTPTDPGSTVEVWRNGSLWGSFTGPLGNGDFPTEPIRPRLGWYHWITGQQGLGGMWDSAAPSRGMYSHGWRLIHDPTNKYNEQSIRALLTS